MKNRRLWALMLAALLVLTAGVTTAFAADAPAAPAEVDAAAPPPVQWMGKGVRGDMGMQMWGPGDDDRFGGRDWLGQHDELLANALDISVEELDEAQEAAYAAALAQAVEDGYITEAQVEKWGDQSGAGLFVLREWYDAGDANAFLAEALGITAGELQAARDNLIPAAVEAGLIEEEDADLMQAGQLIAEAVQSARDEAIAEAVEQGLLTQEQADAMTERGLPGSHGFGDFPLFDRMGPGGMRGLRDFGGFGRPGMHR